MTTENPKRTVKRPHWKEACEIAQARIAELEIEVKRLRASGATDGDIAKIKAESFAAGVAAASQHISK